MTDANGNEFECKMIDIIAIEDNRYILLQPVMEEGVEENGELVIMKLQTAEDGEYFIEEIPEGEFNAVVAALDAEKADEE